MGAYLKIHHQRLALLASVASFCAVPAMAADILVADDVTDNAQKSVGGTDTVTVEQTGVLSVADTAIKWNSESTDLRIVNDGIIESTATDGRAINAGGSATEPRIVTITNGATGIIRAESDAIRINTDITSGTVRLTNAGTILSTVSGQAIDFDGVVSTTAGQIQIDNLAGGVIQSTDADALRPGQGAVITNAGTIYAGKVESLSSDGIDLQAHSGSVINLEGGVISGARHGITTDTDVTVVNYGTIIGRNGSGIGSDGSGSVINHGTIIGDYDGSGNSDGDGIDIDHVGYVENYGTIQALGAAGLHKDGRPNGSDGVTFGHGGIFINHSGALVESVATGVAFGVQATVTNDGTIHAGGLAVATDIGNDVIVNSGTIISESGTAISMGSGDDQLTLLPGSTIIGLVDGNDGNDQITMAGDGDGSFAGAVNFEHLQVASGRWTLTAPSTFSDGTSVADRATLIGTADTLTGAIDNGGTLMIDQSTDAAFAPMLTGTGQLIKTGTGALTIGDQAFIGATRIDRGALLVNGTMLSAITVGSGATLGGTGTVGRPHSVPAEHWRPAVAVLSRSGAISSRRRAPFTSPPSSLGSPALHSPWKVPSPSNQVL